MKLIKSEEVEKVIRKYLKSKKYIVSTPKSHGETGVDIEATKGNRKLFIESIGYNSNPQIKSREFFESFFRIISRDENKKTHKIILALPIRFKNGMQQRKAQYGIAWDKLADIFPNLDIWYVDISNEKIEKFSWRTPY